MQVLVAFPNNAPALVHHACLDTGDATNSSPSTPANDVHSYDSNEDNALASSELFKVNEMFALQGIRKRNMSTASYLEQKFLWLFPVF